MDEVLTVRDLMLALSEHDPDMPVMVAVVKYPHLFPVAYNWENSDAVEVVPIEGAEDLILKDGMLMLAVELTDYSEELREAAQA